MTNEAQVTSLAMSPLNPQHTRYGWVILLALSHSGQPVYEGTVTAKVKARRRALLRVQKLSRRANRA